jgi:hypothetical protein
VASTDAGRLPNWPAPVCGKEPAYLDHVGEGGGGVDASVCDVRVLVEQLSLRVVPVPVGQAGKPEKLIRHTISRRHYIWVSTVSHDDIQVPLEQCLIGEAVSASDNLLGRLLREVGYLGGLQRDFSAVCCYLNQSLARTSSYCRSLTC